jgi:nicotinic acetylcholine receptor, invertebrate
MKRRSLFPVLLVFVMRFLLTMQSPFDHDLKEMLFEDYDMDSPPVEGVTDVQIKFVVTGINEVNTINSYVIVSGSLKHYWSDARLQWDPEEYGGIEKIRLNTDPERNYCIWKPDIVIYECGSQDMEFTLSQVTYDGSMYWSSPGLYQVAVNFELADFPFDTQMIRMSLEPWSHTADLIYLRAYETDPFELRTTTFVNNVEWKIDSFTTEEEYNEYASGNYSKVVFRLYIQRQGNTIERTIIFPALFVSFLAFLYYFLPIGSSEGINFLATLLLTVIMFLVMVTTFIPLSKDTSGIVDMLFILTILLFIIMTIVLIIDWIYNKLPDKKEEE